MNGALCKHKRMFAVVALRRFLCLLALLGVVFGPVSMSVAANAMALSSDMQMEAMPGMEGAEDMSCCPEQQPAQKNECGRACPLALLCSSTILAHEDTGGRRISLESRELSHGLLEDSHLPSAIIEPPARPPKA
ncbi:hypothetical protein [Sinorhizobium sp. BJ1]|uniref:hypothetical protein n=1 Tax=Sinorhizobium sp. BJ1 TaxID=2035455 RepID=UPI000BEA63BE|nr:hypothetical protein [Sinorhizobium sp. BJ1]PDT76536.1 hypothetical protein CO676_33765 [Sinorhizobium sp. BJ1]